MIVRPARTLGEIVTAGEVIHAAFVREKILFPREAAYFLHPQSVGPNALMVIALDDCGLIIGTTGAILDSERGLPLDEVFRPYLSEMRAAYHRIAEVGMIASSTRLDSDTIDHMICLAWWWCSIMGADHIVTSCEPHHTRYYCRRYGVEQVGPTLRYPKFMDALVDLLGGSMAEAQTTKRGGRMIARYQPDADAFTGRFRTEIRLG